MTKPNMTQNLVNLTKNQSFKDFTLIIPSVSVGNVPQLTVDLIIATHNFEKVGVIWHPAIIPSVGGDPYGSDANAVSTSVELYANDGLKVAAIQIRSGIAAKFALHFFKQLKAFIVQQHFKNVLILSSTFAHELHNVRSGHFRFVSNESIAEKMQVLRVQEMEKSPEGGQYLLHGAGFTLKLFETFGEDVNCSVLVKYVSEGDNRPDAYLLLELLYNVVESFKNENVRNVRHPSSWEFVFGGPPPVGLY